jgi:hypothetical protein
MIFTEELERMRRRGRPRKRLKDEVERDPKVLGVRRWREMVTDSEKMVTDSDKMERDGDR